MRPPSSGYPGIMLNAARERLMYPSQTNMACSGVSGAAPMRHPSAQATARERQPMTALENGPTMPTRNSVLASSGSFSIWATPPSANKRDGLGGQPARPRHQRVRKFMRQQRDEEKQGRQNGERPDHVRSPLRVARLELRTQGHGDQQRDYEPAVVETNLDAEQASEPNGRSHRAPLFIRTTSGPLPHVSSVRRV